MFARNALIAAAVAACPLFVSSMALADDAPGTAMTGTSMSTPAGMMPNAAATKDIQNELGTVVDAAASNDPLTMVTNNLSKADRDRFGAEKSVDSTDLTNAVAQFRKDWQAKYGQEFMASDKSSVIFSDQHVKIMQGNTADAMTMPGDKVVNPNTGSMTTGNSDETVKGAVAAAQNTTGAGNQMRGGDIKSDATKNDADRVNSDGRPVDTSHGKDTAAARQLGQQIGAGTGGSPAAVMTPDSMAMVHLLGNDKMKPTIVNLVNDGANAGWKIKLSSDVTSQELHDRMLKCVNKMEDMKSDWPSDVNEAYVVASKRLLMPLGDKPMHMGM